VKVTDVLEEFPIEVALKLAAVKELLPLDEAGALIKL
jgi:hypothetical protein